MRIDLNKNPGMAHDEELDGILSALARPEMAALSDLLLDLRDSAVKPKEAGRCVKVYFELLAAAPASGALARPLEGLRKWLERRLRIEVLDDARMEPLERIPVAFEGERDLDTFCRTAMKNFFNDRCHTTRRIRMQFGFVESRGM